MASAEQNQLKSRTASDASLPGVGAQAPDFCLKQGSDKSTVRLSDYDGRYVLLVFFRGTWCPNCRLQFRVLCENQERLKRAGIAVVGVVCQNAGSVQRYLKSNPLPFPLLIDDSRAVAKQYGVHYWFSYEGFNLANPAIFILDEERNILFAYRGKNQSDLPISSVLEKFTDLLN